MMGYSPEVPSYVEFIQDFFYAKIKHKKYTTKEVFCLNPFHRCPITGNRQFWKKSLRIRIMGEKTTFMCEQHQFEQYLFLTDFDSPLGNRYDAYKNIY